MKREDVSKIIPGITSDQLDSIMNLHGADITAKVNEPLRRAMRWNARLPA